MSLINDALKQANQIPAAATEPAAPRAVGVDHRPRSEDRRPPWIALVILPFALTVVLLLAALFLREWWLSGKSESPRIENAAPAVKQSDHAVASAPAADIRAVAAAPADQAALASTGASGATAPPKLEEAIAKDVASPSPAAVVSVVEVPKPAAPPVPTFKLQGISYSPAAPSAIINGTSVFVGDEVSGATVAKIEPHAVTLEIAGETRVLKMR